MAYGPPKGKARWEGRSEEAAEEDLSYVERLQKFLPPNLADLVRAFLRERCTDSFKSAFVDPEAIAREFAEYVDPQIVDEFVHDVGSSLDAEAGNCAQGIDEKFVVEEVLEAREQLVQQWISLVWAATTFAPGTPVALRSDAFPDLGNRSVPEWERLQQQTFRFLEVNLALGEDEIVRIYTQFCDNLLHATLSNGVALPHDLVLVQKDRQLFVRVRESDSESPSARFLAASQS